MFASSHIFVAGPPYPRICVRLPPPSPTSHSTDFENGRLPRLISEAVALTVRVVAAQNVAVAKLQAALEAGEVAAVEEVNMWAIDVLLMLWFQT